MILLWYPKCSTCTKAEKWLKDNNIPHDTRHIVENNPLKDELAEFHQKSGLPLKRLFNTSGMLYREMGLKDKLPGMSDDEMLAVLSTNGMLVKRPLLVGDDFVLIGFKEKEWTQKLL